LAQYLEDTAAIRGGRRQAPRDRSGEQLSAFDSQRMHVRRQSRQAGLLPDLIQVVMEHQAHGSHAHRGTVAKRSLAKDGRGHGSVIATAAHRLQDDDRSRPVAPIRFPIGHKRLAQGSFLDAAGTDQRLGNGDRHLRVVGEAPGRLRGLFQERARRRVMTGKRLRALPLEVAAQRVADEQAEQAPGETFLQLHDAPN
jgi:hypothetical protein